MATQLVYAIKFVADMDAAVDFHRKQLGLALRFRSPEWSEFDTGPTALALHIASEEQPDGLLQLGFRVGDVDAFCAERQADGVEIVESPRDLHGLRLASLRYPDGTVFGVSGPGP